MVDEGLEVYAEMILSGFGFNECNGWWGIRMFTAFFLCSLGALLHTLEVQASPSPPQRDLPGWRRTRRDCHISNIR